MAGRGGPPRPVPRAALRSLLQRMRAPHPATPTPTPIPPPPGEAALQALLRSPPFCHRRPDAFAGHMEAWFPRAAAGLSPASLALVAQYVARHRLRRPALLDALAQALLPQATTLHTKVIQKLVFPFSRTNYRPANHAELFPRLEALLLRRAAASPLATVNILMSLVQLQHFPLPVLRKVFAPAFLQDVTESPCGLIMRRYLSLLDVAVALEVQGYDGPRLDPRYRVCMFDGALTADEVNHKYSFKGLIAEALRQLVGEEGCWQDEVVPPGYCADFLLHISHSGSFLPRTPQAEGPLEAPAVKTLTLDTLSGSLSRPRWPGRPLAGRLLLPGGSSRPPAPQGRSCSLREEPCPGTSVLRSPATTGSAPEGPPCPSAEVAPGFSPPALDTEPRQPLTEERQRLPAALVASPPGSGPGGTEKALEVHRVVLSVNDKWHYCQDSAVLVGSRAMRDRHLRLLGYHLVQLPYMDLERVSGVEGAKQYLWQRLSRLLGQA